MQKRVYFWAGISWWGKTPGVAWTAEDSKVLFRTKNVCVGTVFKDEGTVWRVVQTRASSPDGNVYYVNHFANPDTIPHRNEWEWSTHDEIKEWHDATMTVPTITTGSATVTTHTTHKLSGILSPRQTRPR